MIEVLRVIFVIGAVVNAVLAVTLLAHSGKNSGVLYMAIAAASATFWNVGAFFYLTLANDLIVLVLIRLQYFAALLISIAFLRFSFSFLKAKVSKPGFWEILALVLSVIVSVIIIFSDNLVSGFGLSRSGIRINEFGNFYIPYSLMVSANFSWAFSNLVADYRIQTGVRRRQLAVLLAGTMSMVFIGVLIALVLPYFEVFNGYWYAPAFTIVFFVYITYAILKHHLFNIEVPINEVLVFLLVVSSFIQVVVATDPLTRNIALLVFVFTIVIGWLLIKSTFALIRRGKRIEEMMEAKGDFLRIASHQLKTPLSVIMGTIDVFRDIDMTTLTEKQRGDLLDGLEMKTIKLNAVVSDMLEAVDVGQTDSAPHNIYNEKTSVRESLQGVVKAIRPDVERKHLKLDVSIKDPADPYHVASLPTAMYRIISIILDNAISYTKEGSITVTLSHEGDSVVLEVRDTGIGIPKDETDKIFERFGRGSNATLAHTDGSGIALYVAQKIIKRHEGGDITVRSEEGVGTVVELRFRRV